MLASQRLTVIGLAAGANRAIKLGELPSGRWRGVTELRLNLYLGCYEMNIWIVSALAPLTAS